MPHPEKTIMEEPSSNLTPCLPDDITLQILIRLPLKTLVRFSCVSKSWHGFIFSNETSIARSHLQYQAPPCRRVWMTTTQDGYFCDNIIPDEKTKYFESVGPRTILRRCRRRHGHGSHYPCFCLGDRMHVIGCCDGVFSILKNCACNSDLKFYLWNPALRQCIFLPRSMAVGYCTIAVGFGFDSYSQDYIVSKVQYAQVVPEEKTIQRVAIYRLKTHSWTTLSSTILDGNINVNGPWILRHNFGIWDSRSCPPMTLDFRNFKPINSRCVIQHGYLYWLEYDRSCEGLDRTRMEYIHATRGDDKGHFDIPDYVTIGRYRELGLYKRCLSVYGYSRAESITDKFELWVMREPNNVWVKQFVIPRELGISIYWNAGSHITPGGRILAYDSASFRRERGRYEAKIEVGRLVLYDPESQKVVDSQDGAPTDYKYLVADNYVESLVSVIPVHKKRFPKRKNKKKKSIWQKFFHLFLCPPV